MMAFKEKLNIVLEGIDIDRLPFPPMGITPAGKWFLKPDGEIVFSIGDEDDKTIGPSEFIKIYKKYFEKHINDAKITRFKEYYRKNMPSNVGGETKRNLPFPKTFNSTNHMWTYDEEDDEVSYVINGEPGTVSAEKFARIYALLRKNQ